MFLFSSLWEHQKILKLEKGNIGSKRVKFLTDFFTHENFRKPYNFQKFLGPKNEILVWYGLRLICLYKYKSLVDKIEWNNGIGKPRRCKSYILECHHLTLSTLEWKGQQILVKYMKVYIWWCRHLPFSLFKVFSTHFCCSK